MESDTIRWDLSALNALPKPVLEGLKKAMAVFTKDRTQTMGALLSTLETGKTRKKKKQKKTKNGKKRHSVAVILVATILMAVFGGQVGYASPQTAYRFGLQQEEALRQEKLRQEQEELRQQREREAKIALEKYFNTSPYTGVPCNFEVTDLEESYGVDAYGCTLYDLGNGKTKIVVEYTGNKGDSIAAWALNAQGEQIFRWDAVGQASGGREKVAFDFPTNRLADVDVLNLDVGHMRIQIDPTPNPVGAPRTHWVYFSQGRYTVHSLTSQDLDNGYVRFTMDFTSSKGLRFSFQTLGGVMGSFDIIEEIEHKIPTDGRQTYSWYASRDGLVRSIDSRVQIYRKNDSTFAYHDVCYISTNYWQ